MQTGLDAAEGMDYNEMVPIQVQFHDSETRTCKPEARRPHDGTDPGSRDDDTVLCIQREMYNGSFICLDEVSLRARIQMPDDRASRRLRNPARYFDSKDRGYDEESLTFFSYSVPR